MAKEHDVSAEAMRLIDASVALVEYGDYECPACGAAYPIVKAIQKRLADRLCFAMECATKVRTISTNCSPLSHNHKAEHKLSDYS